MACRHLERPSQCSETLVVDRFVKSSELEAQEGNRSSAPRSHVQKLHLAQPLAPSLLP